MSTMFQDTEDCGNSIDSKLGRCYNVKVKARLLRRFKTCI